MDTDRFSDQELVARILSGHPDLFGPLVERHIRAAHAIAYARLGNRADAEDAVQEAFLRAYERLASLRDPAKFAAWLLTIARHEAARVAGKRAKSAAPSPLPHAPDADDTGPAHFPDPAQHEMNAIVREHIMRLPEPAREVVLLHYFAGHSAREVAELLDLRRAAVLKRLQRAREQLAETMLRELESARPAAESFTKQAARIAAIAGGLSIPAMMPGGTAAAAGIGVSIKALVASIVLVAAGSVIGVTIWQANESASASEDSSPVPTLPTAQPELTAAVDRGEANNDQSSITNATTHAATPPAKTNSASSRSRDALTAAKEAPPKDLSGTWAVKVIGPEGAIDSFTMIMVNTFLLEDKGTTVRVTPSDDKGLIYGEGMVSRDRIQFTLSSGDQQQEELRIKLELEGAYEPSAMELSLKGTSEYSKFVPAVTSEEKGHYDSPAKVPVEMQWRRIPEKEMSKQQYIKTKTRELQKLARAMLNFTEEHRGIFPTQLEDLEPKYIPSVQPYSPDAGVLVAYSQLPKRTSLAEIDQNYLDDDKSGRPRQERMISVENKLRAYWGDRFLSVKPMLEATYEKYDLVLVITENFEVGPPDSLGCGVHPHAGPMNEAQQKASVQSCQNNMKQLGLSIKMFMNEDPEEREPAGFFMIYPEYLPDKCILICPGSGKAEIAYELLFPAVNRKDLEATYRSLFGDASLPKEDGAAQVYIQPRVPVLIEINECSGSGGRSVLFLDGHTEHRKGRLEDYPDLAPFLNLK